MLRKVLSRWMFHGLLEKNVDLCYRWLEFFCKCQVDSWVSFRSFISLTVFLVCFLMLTRWVRNLYIWLWIFFLFLISFWSHLEFCYLNTYCYILLTNWLFGAGKYSLFWSPLVLFYYKDLNLCGVSIYIYIYFIYIHTQLLLLYLWIYIYSEFF